MRRPIFNAPAIPGGLCTNRNGDFVSSQAKWHHFAKQPSEKITDLEGGYISESCSPANSRETVIAASGTRQLARNQQSIRPFRLRQRSGLAEWRLRFEFTWRVEVGTRVAVYMSWPKLPANSTRITGSCYSPSMREAGGVFCFFAHWKVICTLLT